MPYIGDMPPRTLVSSPKRRDRKRQVPPHAPLGALRHVAGWSLDELADRIAETTGNRPQKGSLCAIESGLRGISVDLLIALEQVYGLKPGTISTSYEPRATKRNGKAVA